MASTKSKCRQTYNSSFAHAYACHCCSVSKRGEQIAPFLDHPGCNKRVGSTATSACDLHLLFDGFASVCAEFDADARGYYVVVAVHAMVSERNIIADVIGSKVYFVFKAHMTILKANNHIRMEQMLDAHARDPAVVPLLVKDGAGCVVLQPFIHIAPGVSAKPVQ